MRTNGYAPVVIMQATHSGRYSKPHGVPAPLIAYNNPIFEKDSPISSDRIVTDEYLDRVGEALVKGAVLAEKAGFDGRVGLEYFPTLEPSESLIKAREIYFS